MTTRTPEQIATEHAQKIAQGSAVVKATPEALAEFLRCAIEADRAQRVTDDEREALARIIQGFEGDPEYWQNFRDAAEAILAAGFRRQGSITDEMVDAALNAYLELDSEAETYPAAVRWRERNGRYMRAALEAAERARC
jgi:hypothetical protein